MKMSKEETKGEKEDVIKYTQAEILAENIQLKAAVDKMTKKIDELTANFNSATQQLEAETKSKKIERILRVSELGMDYLLGKSLSELDEIEDLYQHVKSPKFLSTGDNSKFASGRDEALWKLNNMFKFDKK